MSPLTLRLVRSALVFLAAGVALGAAFAISRALGASLRPLHAELNLWGCATLLTYGVAYHMLPRFAGRPLPRPRLAEAQSWLALAGVLAASLGWAASAAGHPAATPLRAAGALTQLAAALIFVWIAAGLLRR